MHASHPQAFNTLICHELRCRRWQLLGFGKEERENAIERPGHRTLLVQLDVTGGMVSLTSGASSIRLAIKQTDDSARLPK